MNLQLKTAGARQMTLARWQHGLTISSISLKGKLKQSNVHQTTIVQILNSLFIIQQSYLLDIYSSYLPKILSNICIKINSVFPGSHFGHTVHRRVT